MKHGTTIAVAAILVCFQSPALSQTATAWEGFYAGVLLGTGAGESDADMGGGFNAIRPISGSLGGGYAGYNFNAGAVVLGVEADYQWSNISFNRWLDPTVHLKAGIDSLGTLRARVGVPIDNAMIYGTAGLAFGQLVYAAKGSGISDFSYSDWAFGYAVGAGIEVAASDTISIKAEYLHIDIRDADYREISMGQDAFSHVFRAGIGYHF